MLKVLVNAYAVSPSWGSEPGMGWNWVVNLAKYCEVFVITEGEWKVEIERALEDLPQRGNLHFYYNPVSEKIRKMCWNQGDWRFYWYYRKWQMRTLEMAREIVAENEIDIIHQLNMIGFREPGFLWKIKGIPFVWGPVGGMELMPLAYIKGEPFSLKFKVWLKNVINNWQRKHYPRVISALKRADVVIAATKGVYDVISDYHKKPVLLINETGCYENVDKVVERGDSEGVFNILWVGKFDFRKQLGLALKIVAAIPRTCNVKLHIIGDGNEVERIKYRQLAVDLGVDDAVVWHGAMPHDEVMSFMGTCDLFLFTSIMEGTPHVVLEALQNNLPVVCFDACGQSEVVNNQVGVKIPVSDVPQSVADFSSAIEALIKDKSKLELLRKNCSVRQKELAWDNKAKYVVNNLYSTPPNRK